MGLMDYLGPGVGAVSSLYGLFSSAAQQHQAEIERQQYLSQIGLDNAQGAGTQAGYNRMSLMSAAGRGGDAINAMGKRLASGLANAGVYGSSGVGGAMVNSQRDQQASLGELAARMAQEEAQQRYAAMQRLSELGAQYANEDLGCNRQMLGQSVQGVAGFLDALARLSAKTHPQTQPQASSPPAALQQQTPPGTSFDVEYRLAPGPGAFNDYSLRAAGLEDPIAADFRRRLAPSWASGLQSAVGQAGQGAANSQGVEYWRRLLPSPAG